MRRRSWWMWAITAVGVLPTADEIAVIEEHLARVGAADLARLVKIGF